MKIMVIFAIVWRLRGGSFICCNWKISTPPRADILQAELLQTSLVQELCLVEEILLKQKSRIQCLSEGDRNTTFFHNMVKKKHSRDHIMLLFDLEGNRLPTYEEIAAEAIRFYQNILGTPDPR